MAGIATVGAGHLGLVYAAGLADLGHTVTVLDIDPQRIERLSRGDIWFFEPGLQELVDRGLRSHRLRATTSYVDALAGADFVFLCVQTPSSADGTLDDSALQSTFASIRDSGSASRPIIVNKSTSPVGTADLAAQRLGDRCSGVVASPEFLAEGRAVSDFFHPDRIVIGARDRQIAVAVGELFAPLQAAIVYTDTTTAELVKLAANAFLAIKVSYANMLARLCDSVGADVDHLVQILGQDPRIGSAHLRPGLGFGGACLPKDTTALARLVEAYGGDAGLPSAALRVNQWQRDQVVSALRERLGRLHDRRVAILGLAFKAGTDDTRGSPGVEIAQNLLADGARVVAYDPVVRTPPANGEKIALLADSVTSAARDADALVFATDWPQFAALDLHQLKREMRGRLLIDGRGLVSPITARAMGFDYIALGRSSRHFD